MKITRQMWIATLRATLIMGAISVAALVLTVPAHAEAVGEMANKGSGVITLYDDPCPGASEHAHLASASSLAVGVNYGCWFFETQTVVRVIWLMPGKDGTNIQVPLRYNVSDFHKPLVM